MSIHMHTYTHVYIIIMVMMVMIMILIERSHDEENEGEEDIISSMKFIETELIYADSWIFFYFIEFIHFYHAKLYKYDVFFV